MNSAAIAKTMPCNIIEAQFLNENNSANKNNNNGLTNIKVSPVINPNFSGSAFILSNIIITTLRSVK